MSLYLFDFIEPIPARYRGVIPPYMQISSGTTYDVLLIRLLTSTIKLKNKKSGKTITPKNNYTTFPSHQLTKKSARPITALISPFTLPEYIRYSQKFYGRNISFYYNLLQEFSFYFSYSQEKQYQSAFVNLYRSLEYLAYSFPLIHASRFSNYLGTFEALRGYLLDDKTSEIKFFNRFVAKLFESTPYLGFTTTFSFTHPDVTVANNCFDSLFNQLNIGEWQTSNKATHTLSTENSKLLTLFSNTRNRYFHFAVGKQRNIQNTDLKDPDFFFECINEKFLNWLCFIYANVLKESLDNTLL
jgi:hypothetical protein